METGTGHRGGNRLLIAVAIATSAFALGITIPSGSAALAGSETRSLTPAQKKAKSKALANCRKIKAKPRRTACIKRVNQKYAPKPNPIGKTWEVDVWDNYYAPGILEIGVNDAVEWVWKEDSREGHNVSLLEGPRGVSPYDFESNVIYSSGSRFKRQFKVAGTYRLFCTLHAGMEMQVDVGN